MELFVWTKQLLGNIIINNYDNIDYNDDNKNNINYNNFANTTTTTYYYNIGNNIIPRILNNISCMHYH